LDDQAVVSLPIDTFATRLLAASKKILKKAEGSSKKGSSSKTGSKKGKGSGADKAK
jgi:hypothetical protein